MEGQIFSHYQVLERLGGGGMGVVYKALDTTLDRHVALKFLPPELTRDDEARRRFMQEAKAASALDHPNVCNIHEIASTPDDQLFIAMGYYAGETLKTRIARGPVPVGAALDIIRQVAEGLDEAHAAGIVHRDIKPANIIVTKSGLVKILDFGIAKLTGATGLTETGITLGTVSYMSPEQVNGEDAGPQSDVWALGAVFYELLTGQPPFPGDRPAVVLHGITDRVPTPVRGRCPDASPDIVRVVTGALEKSRARRYATVGDLLAAIPATGATAAPEAAALSGTSVTRSIEATVGPGTASAEVPSIAVLPFENMSADPEQEYFCDGLTEELIDALARLDGLRVVARTSAFQFKGQAHDLRNVGRQLGVGTVLEGSVRKVGSRLRINAQLINADDGCHLWSERYDRELHDIFAVQDEIARSVVDRLQVELLGSATSLLVRPPTKSLEAHTHYLQGRHYRHSRGNVLKACQCFERAVQEDPAYAAAWAGLAEATVTAGYYMGYPPREAARKAREAVERALALDDGLSEAHTSLGLIRFWFDWQWLESEQDFTRAIELDRASPYGLIGYARFLAFMGRTEEALGQAARAREADPLSAHALSEAAVALMIAGRYDEALVTCQRALELQPDMTGALWWLALIHLELGRFPEALRALRAVPPGAAGLPLHQGTLGGTLGKTGDFKAARQVLGDLHERSQHDYVPPFALATTYNGLGEFDRCVDYLEQVYEERSPTMLFFVGLPFWAPVRRHPRGQDLLRRMNLPHPPTSSPAALL